MFADTNGSQFLIALTDQGTIVCIENMDIDAIYSSSINKGSNLTELLQRLQFQKTSMTLSSNVSHAIMTRPTMDSPITISFTDKTSKLFSIELTLSPTVAVTSPTLICQFVRDKFYILPSITHGFIAVVLRSHNEIAALRSDGTELAVLTLPHNVDQLGVVDNIPASPDISAGVNAAVTVLLLTPSTVSASTSGELENTTGQIIVLLINPTSARFVHVGSGTLPVGAVYLDPDSAESGSLQYLSMHEGALSVLRFAASVSALTNCLKSTLSGTMQGASATTSLTVLLKVTLDLLHGSYSPLGDDSEYCEHALKHFAAMSSGHEVMYLLYLLLDVHSPPEGFVRKLLVAAEVISCL